VPPLRLEFMVRGLVATPDAAGTAEALRRVADGRIPPSNRTEAIERIERSMAPEVVVARWLAMVEEARERPTKHVYQAEPVPSVRGGGGAILTSVIGPSAPRKAVRTVPRATDDFTLLSYEQEVRRDRS